MTPTEEAKKVAPIAGTHVITFVDANGKTVELAPHEAEKFDVAPLGFVDLVRAAESKNPSIDVVIENAQAATSETGLELEGPLTATLGLGNNGPVVAYGLVEGGWLPMPWAHKRIAWVDRNVVLNLEKLKVVDDDALRPGDRGWLTRWLGLDVEEVSPILFVLEGAKRKPPTDFEMRAELTRATKVLRAALPGAKVQSVDSAQRRALHRMTLDYAVSRSRAMRLLVRAAPLVVNSVKPDGRLALEEQILELARQENVTPTNLAVLALLSCVYDANPALSTHRAAQPGRAVLKPKGDYDLEDAYNAMADLYFVELMVNAQAAFPHMKQVLYTGDVGIASFWTALQPMSTETVNLPLGRMRTTARFNLGAHLFPALSEGDVIALQHRLGQ